MGKSRKCWTQKLYVGELLKYSKRRNYRGFQMVKSMLIGKVSIVLEYIADIRMNIS